jgi:hypothetical protein
MEELTKNLWLLLTIVLPGMATYGVFRLLIVFYDCKADTAVFEKLDNSTLVSACLVAAIALMQQAISIGIEALLAQIVKLFQKQIPNYYQFFCNRFQMLATGKLTDGSTRIFGYFFTSVNITIGQLLLLAYLLHAGLNYGNEPVRIVTVLVLAGIVSSWFRLCNAVSIIPTVMETIAKE